jgi:nucleoside-diphosphate-sugar epimerase
MRRQMDTTKMKEYGFKRIYTLEMGLKETIEYYEEIQR